LGGRKGIRHVQTEWWGAGMVICLERSADLHMAQLMPLPLTVSLFNKIQIGFTFLVLAHLGCPGQRALKRVCVVCIISCGVMLQENTESNSSQLSLTRVRCTLPAAKCLAFTPDGSSLVIMTHEGVAHLAKLDSVNPPLLTSLSSLPGYISTGENLC